MTAGKRRVDVVLSAVGLTLLAPLLVLIGFAIKLDDCGPVLFRPTRVGCDGKVFHLWKFRTMIVDARERGPGITFGEDPRITRVGRVLRRYKLDELPQLFNVLVGTMSLVGPRPEAPEYVAMYTDQQRAVLRLVPGITDPASAMFVDEARILGAASDPLQHYIKYVMPAKIQMNLEYAARATPLSDIRVMLTTLKRIAQAG